MKRRRRRTIGRSGWSETEWVIVAIGGAAFALWFFSSRRSP
jgi:hypothetical protein